MRKISLFIGLTRWKDWILNIGFVLFGVFLPLKVFEFYPSLIFMIIIFFLVQSFGFAINDYFDAPFDVLKKHNRNPISLGLIKKQEAAVFCTALAVFGLSIGYFFLPFGSFLLIALLYLAFFVYSSPPFRFKEKSFLDIITHGLFTPLLLMASYTLVSTIEIKIILISTAAFASSIIVCITQETRDVNPDKESGFKTTVGFLGYRRSLYLVRLLFIFGIASFSAAVILFMPKYVILLIVGSFFPLKFAFGNPLQEEFYPGSIISWNKAIICMFFIGVSILPFYMGWI